MTSSSDYLGQEQVSVPAFPEPGAGGEGAVRGHAGGGPRRPVRQRRPHGLVGVRRRSGEGRLRARRRRTRRSRRRCCITTTQTAPPPPDARYFPLVKGAKAHVPLDELEAHEEAVGPGVHGRRGPRTARPASTSSSVSGPIKVAGAYGFTLAADGLTNIWATTAVGVAREAAAARAEGPARRQAAPPLLHAVRPDGLRLQPGPARVSGGGRRRGCAHVPAATSPSSASRGTTKVLGAAVGQGAGGHVRGARRRSRR